MNGPKKGIKLTMANAKKLTMDELLAENTDSSKKIMTGDTCHDKTKISSIHRYVHSRHLSRLFCHGKTKPEKESGDSPRNQMKSVNPSTEFNERKFDLLGGDRRGGALMILWRCSLLLASTPPYPRGELRISSLFSSHSHSFFLQLGVSQ